MSSPAQQEPPLQQASGVMYVCQRCTNCCRWPGFVRLSDAEIMRISRFLGMSEHDFIQRFTRLRPQRSGLALVDNARDGACIFLEGDNCLIQPVKPDQCRDFPNAWNFPGWRDVCHAFPVGHHDGTVADPPSRRRRQSQHGQDFAD